MPCTARGTGPRRAAILAASSNDPLDKGVEKVTGNDQ